MSYEYRNKRIIENFARRYTTNVSDEVDILFELEHVYSQATKADEYEAKAKAYNDTLKTLDKLIDNDERYKEARSNDFVAGMLLAYEKIFILMEDYIKESGESDA